jgi:hypothetical protein
MVADIECSVPAAAASTNRLVKKVSLDSAIVKSELGVHAALR